MSGIFLISHALIGYYRNEIIQTLNGGIQVEILFINIYNDRSVDCQRGLDFSLLELIFGEHTVLVVLIVGLSWDSCLVSLFVLGIGLLLEITLSVLNVLKSFSESILNGKDLSGGLIQEVINF